jgi:hypothetical protein
MNQRPQELQLDAASTLFVGQNLRKAQRKFLIRLCIYSLVESALPPPDGPK